MSSYSKGILYCLIFLIPALVFSQESEFIPFTGRITGNKVRLRLSPDLEGKIIQEAQKDDLLIVTGETEDFYATSPPPQMKAYIFRTFVLEGIVEGSRVNVRLEPTLDSPVIAQLNSGDKIEGEVCEENNKWLEITPPSSVSLYIYKDYVNKVGDIHYLSQIEERRKEINQLLNTAYLMSQEEMQKPFEEIDLETITSVIHEITAQYEDFPDHTKRARDLLTLIQDHYLQQKADYLEFKSKENSEVWREKNSELLSEMESQRNRLQELEKQLIEEKAKSQPVAAEKPFVPVTPSNMQESLFAWMSVEQQLFKEWQEQHEEIAMEEYYRAQEKQSKELSGILKPYDRIVKNKPGDFMLINPTTQTPVAFLYSTNVDLQQKLGEQVTLQVSPRPDHHFAFPAYFVHHME